MRRRARLGDERRGKLWTGHDDLLGLLDRLELGLEHGKVEAIEMASEACIPWQACLMSRRNNGQGLRDAQIELRRGSDSGAKGLGVADCL